MNVFRKFRNKKNRRSLDSSGEGSTTSNEGKGKRGSDNINTKNVKKGGKGGRIVTKVFGGVLEPTSSTIPGAVSSMLEYLEVNGICETGIFRIPGQLNAINELRNKYDSGEIVDLFTVKFPHNVSGLLKLYLREMKEPVVPFDVFDKLMLLDGLNKEDMLKKIKEILVHMPTSNYLLLKRLLHFLYDVAAHAAVNMMNTANLAVVMGPCLLRKKQVDIEDNDFVDIHDDNSTNDDKKKKTVLGGEFSSSNIINSIVKTMIEQYTYLFSNEGDEDVLSSTLDERSGADGDLVAIGSEENLSPEVSEKLSNLLHILANMICSLGSRFENLLNALKSSNDFDFAVYISESIRSIDQSLREEPEDHSPVAQPIPEEGENFSAEEIQSLIENDLLPDATNRAEYIQMELGQMKREANKAFESDPTSGHQWTVHLVKIVRNIKKYLDHVEEVCCQLANDENLFPTPNLENGNEDKSEDHSNEVEEEEESEEDDDEEDDDELREPTASENEEENVNIESQEKREKESKPRPIFGAHRISMVNILIEKNQSICDNEKKDEKKIEKKNEKIEKNEFHVTPKGIIPQSSVPASDLLVSEAEFVYSTIQDMSKQLKERLSKVYIPSAAIYVAKTLKQAHTLVEIPIEKEESLDKIEPYRLLATVDDVASGENITKLKSLRNVSILVIDDISKQLEDTKSLLWKDMQNKLVKNFCDRLHTIHSYLKQANAVPLHSPCQPSDKSVNREKTTEILSELKNTTAPQDNSNNVDQNSRNIQTRQKKENNSPAVEVPERSGCSSSPCARQKTGMLVPPPKILTMIAKLVRLLHRIKSSLETTNSHDRVTSVLHMVSNIKRVVDSPVSVDFNQMMLQKPSTLHDISSQKRRAFAIIEYIQNHLGEVNDTVANPDVVAKSCNIAVSMCVNITKVLQLHGEGLSNL